MTFGRILFLVGLSVGIISGLLLIGVTYLLFFVPQVPSVYDSYARILFLIPFVLLLIAVFVLWTGIRLDRGKSRVAGGLCIIILGVLQLIAVLGILLAGGSFSLAERYSGWAYQIQQGELLFLVFGTICISAGFRILRHGAAGIPVAIPLPEGRVYADRSRLLGYAVLLSIPLVSAIAFLLLR